MTQRLCVSSKSHHSEGDGEVSNSQLSDDTHSTGIAETEVVSNLVRPPSRFPGEVALMAEDVEASTFRHFPSTARSLSVTDKAGSVPERIEQKIICQEVETV